MSMATRHAAVIRASADDGLYAAYLGLVALIRYRRSCLKTAGMGTRGFGMWCYRRV